MYYIGIDLGTSSVKMLLMDKDGNILKRVSKDYPISFPHPGWSEQNPEDWYKQTLIGLKELIIDISKEKIEGIGIGGQMHGLVVLDEKDCVIRPAILWNDNRTIKENEYLNEVIGKDFLSKNTGNISFTGFTAAKLLWMKNNEVDKFKKISKIMLPKDYLVYKFTGVHSTDVSDASGTLIFDVKNRCWSKEMIDICGIKREQLPNIYESYEVVGNLNKDLMEELGINTKVKIVAGASDNAAAAIGTGTIGNGNCNLSLGTSGTVFISSDKFIEDENNSIHSFDHADGNYHLLGCMLSAASCNKWWNDEILKTKEYKKEQEKIKDLAENEVYFLPHLMGERSPYNDPNARGVFIGMNMNTKREDMTLAVLEGVSFAFRDIIEVSRKLGVNPTNTKICGGGAKSKLWIKILSNVLNMNIEIIENEEGASLGGAILAAVSCGAFASLEEATNKIVKISEIFMPEESLVKKYEKKYSKYKEIYPSIKNLYKKL